MKMALIPLLTILVVLVITGGVVTLAVNKLPNKTREGFGRKGGPFMQQARWQPLGTSNGGAYDGLDFSGKDRLADQESMEVPFLPYPDEVGEGLGSIDPFALNQFRPECCPGPMTSSTGCICLSRDQRVMLRSSGGVPGAVPRPV